MKKIILVCIIALILATTSCQVADSENKEHTTETVSTNTEATSESKSAETEESSATENTSESQTESETEEPISEAYGVKLGMTLSEVNSIIGRKNLIAIPGGYKFFKLFKTESGENVVVEFDNSSNLVKKIRVFEPVTFHEKEFNKIVPGMTVYDVVELIGIPTHPITDGALKTSYLRNDGKWFYVYWWDEQYGKELVVRSTYSRYIEE